MNVATMTVTAKERRAHNLALAKSLASMGIYVFPSKDKTPMCAVWQRADTDFTPEQRSAETAKFEQKHGFPPPHVGSTVDPKIITKLWRQFEDAVPSISCGPSNLYVIDADFAVASEGKRAKNGPEKLADYLANNEIPLDGAVVIDTQSGGKHLYFKNSAGLDSKAGILRDLDCDVRGIGGQTVAPGAIRVDGKHYKIALGELGDLSDLPDVPEGVVAAVRTARETTEVKDAVVAASIARLEETDIPSFADVFDPIMGYDIDALSRKDEEFAELYKNGTGDISRNRFKMARCLMREWPNMPIEHLLSFNSGWVLENGEDAAGAFNDGSSKKCAGEYNYRDIAREHAKGVSEHKVSDGLSMGAVDDEVDDLPAEQTEIKKVKNAQKRRAIKSARINPKSFKYVKASELPPRQFIWLDWLLLEELTLMVAPGARGKSALMLSVAICMACGVDVLCGQKLFRPRRIFLYNTEDAVTEMQRRASTFMEFHNFTQDMIALVEANLFLQSGKEDSLVFTQTDGRAIASRDVLITELEDFIIDKNVEFVFLDPLITLHDAGENDNNAMALVTQIFRDIQSNTKVGMMIAHHSRKTSTGAGSAQQNANDARGASSIVTAARVVLNINKVPAAEGMSFGMTDPKDEWRYFIVSKGDKVNLSPNDKSVTCFRMNSIIVNNGTPEFRNDNNLAISPVERRAVQNLSPDHRDELLYALDDQGAQYRATAKSDATIIELFAARMGREGDDAQTIKDIRALLKVWEASGWIVQSDEVIIGAANRTKRKVWRRGAKRPPAAAPATNFAVPDDEEI